jgi:TonB family protein
VSTIYTGDERNVVPPQTLAQTLPKYPGAVPPRGVTGVVEVVIDEGGTVESAAMVVPVTASYDKMVMNAATKWVYIPAMMNGKPVKFRKRIQITVTPPAP